MSISVMTRVWLESPREGKELLIELALADFADDQGRSWPAVETLAKKARCSDRHVQATIRKMVQDGDLEVGIGEGPYGANLYTLLTGGVKSLHPAADDPQGVKSLQGGVKPTTQNVSPTSPDPSLEPSNDPPDNREPDRDPVATPSARKLLDHENGGRVARSDSRAPVVPEGSIEQFARLLVSNRLDGLLREAEYDVVDGFIVFGGPARLAELTDFQRRRVNRFAKMTGFSGIRLPTAV